MKPLLLLVIILLLSGCACKFDRIHWFNGIAYKYESFTDADGIMWSSLSRLHGKTNATN